MSEVDLDRQRLAKVWEAFGCAPNLDAFKPTVREGMWRQVLEMARESVADGGRIYRELQRAEDQANNLAGDVAELERRLRKAEAERDMLKQSAQARIYERAMKRAERAEAVIAEALAATKRGTMLTPPWVIDILATYQNGADQ